MRGTTGSAAGDGVALSSPFSLLCGGTGRFERIVKHQLVVQAADEPRPCGGHSGWEQQRVQATKVGASSVSCETVTLRDGLGLGIGEVTKFEKMRIM